MMSLCHFEWVTRVTVQGHILQTYIWLFVVSASIPHQIAPDSDLNDMAHQHTHTYIVIFILIHRLKHASVSWLGLSSSLRAEVSRVPGRKEALRVPPSETVAYQRPDHRLRPSTRTFVVAGLCPWQGEIWLDQKTPEGPQDCPAGSWSCWDTFHFNSSERQRNQGAVFQKEK